MGKDYHSRFYHRFFEGYTEKEMPDEKGNMKINRVYTGEYYYPVLTKEEYRAHKALNVTAYLTAVFSYVLSGIQRVPLNTVWYLALLQSGVLVSLIWFLWPLYYSVTQKGKMTVSIYKDASLRLKYVSLGSACLLTGIVLLSCIYIVMNGTGVILKSLCVLGGYGISASAMFAIFLYEGKVNYQVVMNTMKKTEKSITIRY